MFMRYRGGGFGHLYMRAIEVWLAETGWGSDDILASKDESESFNSNQSSEDDGEDSTSANGDSDGEVGRSDSEQGDLSDVDPDAEDLSTEEDEETVEGEFGFSCY